MHRNGLLWWGLAWTVPFLHLCCRVALLKKRGEEDWRYRIHKKQEVVKAAMEERESQLWEVEQSFKKKVTAWDLLTWRTICCLRFLFRELSCLFFWIRTLATPHCYWNVLAPSRWGYKDVLEQSKRYLKIIIQLWSVNSLWEQFRISLNREVVCSCLSFSLTAAACIGSCTKCPLITILPEKQTLLSLDHPCCFHFITMEPCGSRHLTHLIKPNFAICWWTRTFNVIFLRFSVRTLLMLPCYKPGTAWVEAGYTLDWSLLYCTMVRTKQ